MNKTAIIVARDNGYGLTIDTELLADALTALGWEVEAASPRSRPLLDRLFKRRKADAVFHLERVFPQWTSAGAVNFAVPNQERFPQRHLSRLRKIDAVLAKSRHAREVFSHHHGHVHHIGFVSRDRFDATVEKDFRGFFHLAGGSTLKGTDAIVALWEKHPDWPVLVLVQKKDNAPGSVPKNIRLHSGFVDDDALKQMQNASGVHLCPSLSEGWGHHIHEGLSCGAIIVTTDGPPMNEFVDKAFGAIVAVDHTESRHLGTNYHIRLTDLERHVSRLLQADVSELAEMGQQARRQFADNKVQFQTRLKQAISATVANGDFGQ